MIQANNHISDVARKEAGVPVHKTTRTPVTAPTTEPVGFVMASDRLEHLLTYADSTTPTRRARPTGVTGVEIYLYIGDQAPQTPSSYKFLRISSRTPDRVSFEAQYAGQIANYLIRWVNAKGQTGPWSQIISATIPAV